MKTKYSQRKQAPYFKPCRTERRLSSHSPSYLSPYPLIPIPSPQLSCSSVSSSSRFLLLGFLPSSSMEPTKSSANYSSAHVAIRLLLFASSVAGIIVIATSKQTTRIPIPGSPFSVSLTAKFNHSPALIFLNAAFIAACSYSLSTLITVAIAARKCCPSTKLLFHLLVLDAIMVGVMAAATGAGGAVAYIGLKGNSYVRWNKICGMYDGFCRHVGSAVGLSLVSAIALLLLTILSGHSLYRRSH